MAKNQETAAPAAEMDRQSFASFIARKRRDAGLTQEELAGRLYVTHTTVSKWERGISYPDISLVPGICRELGISEHEFFTACDDLAGRRAQRDARRWRGMTRAGQTILCVCYGLTVLICFICDLAVFHRLDWFWIVLTSLMLAFSLTTLPVLVKRSRAVVCLASATVCLLLLLLSCGLYAGMAAVGRGLAITAACLLLPWGLYALWRLCRQYRPTLSLLLLTVWTYLLLLVIWLVTGGDWLFSLAFPIATLSYAFVWIYFAVAHWLPLHPCLKAGLLTAVTALAIPAGTSFADALTGGQAPGRTFAAYFDWSRGMTVASEEGTVTGNRLVFWLLLAAAAVLLAVGAGLALRRRKRVAAGKEE